MEPAETLHERLAELLQRLIRFDTTNPPGNERPCIEWIAELVRAAGVEPQIVAKDPARPSLIARLRGAGTAPPFLSRVTSTWCRLRATGSTRRSAATSRTATSGVAAPST